MRTLICTIALIALAGVAHADDSVTLKSGRTLTGKILRTGETVVSIETVEGIEWIKRSDIETIARAAKPTEKVIEKVTEARPPVRRDEPAARRKVEPQPTEARGDVVAKNGVVVKSAGPVEEASSEQLAQILVDLGSKKRELRAAASQWIVENWPASRRALDSALVCKNEVARLEAVRLLENEVLGNTTRKLRTALKDPIAVVRVTALRAIRHRNYDTFEQRAVAMMQSDSEWVVRQEAIRTLEEIGAREALRPVIAAWSTEEDADRKRRYRRVLRAILMDDFGDGVDAWHKAVDEVHLGRRNVRGD